MGYAIIRNQKYKRGNLKGIFRHNERKNTNYSNKNIDRERTPLNFHIKQPTFSYEKEFEEIKSKYNLKGQIKEVSNIVCEYIITSSKEFFEDIGELETKRYFETAHKFASAYKNLGEQYILSSVVHLDEETPHMHLVFIPVVHTKDKKGQDIDKVDCSEFWKAKDSYRQLQDAFFDYMTSNRFDLNRGITSDKKHIPVSTFKEITGYNNITNTGILQATPIKVQDIKELPKLTRKRDKQISLNDRIAFAKEKNSDILLSIHQNSLPNRDDIDKKHGVGTYYYHPQARPLAQKIQDNLLSATNFKDDKVNFASFALTRPTSQLSVLIECGYIIRKEEAEKLTNRKFQKLIARAITKGCEEYLKESFN